eukprot:4733796-Pleurochrysis_carterae.AAC.1
MYPPNRTQSIRAREQGARLPRACNSSQPPRPPPLPASSAAQVREAREVRGAAVPPRLPPR